MMKPTLFIFMLILQTCFLYADERGQPADSVVLQPDPTDYGYEYNLTAEDDKWKRIEDEEEVINASLQPGVHRLCVRTDDAEQVALFEIKVEHHPFFRILLCLFAGMGILCAILLRSWLRRRSRKRTSQAGQESDTDRKYKNTKQVSREEADKIIADLQVCMEKEKMYLNPNLKIAELATRLNCSPVVLSQVFSRYLNVNYNDFVNVWRIGEFKQKAGKSDSSRYTLEALSRQCGFNSQASFFRSFKKITGHTPNEYIRKMEKKK